MKNIYNLYKIKELIENQKNIYRIYITCDANDGDDVNSTLNLNSSDFYNDVLLQYVLSYVSKYIGKFGHDWSDNVYGHHIAENKHFYWLYDYCCDKDLLLYAGMCDDMCHSISDLNVTYFDNNGVEHFVEIPDFDTLFDTIEEAQEVMNKEYDKYLDNIKNESLRSNNRY